jgi:ATP synthase subunit 6
VQEKILPPAPVEALGWTVQYGILFWSTVVMVIVALLGWWLGRRLKKVPGRRQVVAEMIVDFFDGLCRDVLGPGRGRSYLPVFGSLFLFITVANVIGVVPLSGLTAGYFPAAGLEVGGERFRDFNDDGAWQPGEPAVGPGGETIWTPHAPEGEPGAEREYRRAGFFIPPVEEPTRNINVPMGISIMLAIGMYAAVVFHKGIKGLIRAFTEPLWFMLPLNMVSAVAQIVSVSFRLFGNIFGGAIIFVIAVTIIYNLIPPVLDVVGVTLASWLIIGFLGLFVGVVQAFVFTMLWLTYHGDVLAEEEAPAAP